jgi:signal transduction histidine kinase
VTSLPPLAQFTFLALESLTYHFLSYSLGLLGGMESRQRRELMHANAELRAMQQIEADSARLAERLTIARELHDSMGHHLTGLSVNLQLATRVGPEKARQAIDEAYMLSRLLLSDVRTVVTDLRDLHAVRLAEALRTLGANVQTPMIHLDIDPAMEDGLPPLVSHALFRCVQEIITNTIRHSGARNLWIKLLSVGRRYELHSRDDGHGVAHLVWGNGLTGMRERVEELDGSMTLTTRAGAGFAVTVALPETEVS